MAAAADHMRLHSRADSVLDTAYGSCWMLCQRGASTAVRVRKFLHGVRALRYG
jgi:hypothetical protein